MTNAYFGAGAKAYFGWDESVTVGHGNEWAVNNFDMQTKGDTVDRVVSSTPADGWPYFAKLTYFGDGGLTLN
jgi:hypothetical protein